MLMKRQPGPLPDGEASETQKWIPQGGPVPPDHSSNGRRVDTSLGLIQHSNVTPLLVPTSRLADAGTLTCPLVPSKLKACPASPEVKLMFPCKVPSLAPAKSVALFSACHQATNPDGGAAQVGSFTVRMALELTTEPNAFVTCTE